MQTEKAKAYLNALPAWDGVPRLSAWLEGGPMDEITRRCVFVGTTNPDYLRGPDAVEFFDKGHEAKLQKFAQFRRKLGCCVQAVAKVLQQAAERIGV